uniref:Coenzyme Q-binding protein COQ10 START domain-containing protein n=1 Tax=Chaetoceros debilis TaxID=122233 RepID=A0A7S3QJ75_9STRA|mmetsp:Transcript_9904/g.14916  ORF Transcript_9904/g.14916 Transcript_9904/m.14916 type:complete len:255 (+) Transcript_9904:132-896(+)
MFQISPKILSIALLVLGLSLSLLQVEAKKINRDAGHTHNGLLTPYSPGAFNMKMESKDEEILGKGNSVMKNLPADNDPEGKLGGKAICVQDIDAPKKAVWRQILDMDSYVGKVSKVKECNNYSVEPNSDGTVRFKTKMVLGVMPGYSYENYYDHSYNAEKGSVTWSLDYKKFNDFDDVAGHWHVEDHPTKAGKTRVFYACDLKVKNTLPKPIMNFLQKTALKQATAWVKKESEGDPSADIPSQYKNTAAVTVEL